MTQSEVEKLAREMDDNEVAYLVACKAYFKKVMEWGFNCPGFCIAPDGSKYEVSGRVIFKKEGGL